MAVAPAVACEPKRAGDSEGTAALAVNPDRPLTPRSYCSAPTRAHQPRCPAAGSAEWPAPPPGRRQKDSSGSRHLCFPPPCGPASGKACACARRGLRAPRARLRQDACACGPDPAPYRSFGLLWGVYFLLFFFAVIAVQHPSGKTRFQQIFHP